MDIFIIVLGVLVVAGIAATVKDLLLDGYRPRPLDPDRLRLLDRKPARREARKAPRARRSLRLPAPRHPRSLG
ncbi:hypothetical protein [Desertivibrio insolitus]|uniref:hypothetical protein n=1 Tax=Herbiconiux sp. SYSU D00978 TaxID=2812562 RepID=UPI001A9704B7|nr:hypothetical protein [Herbiconiux sp. SYSU D00978]